MPFSKNRSVQYFLFFAVLLLPIQEARSNKVAVWRIDALGGLSEDIVLTLENLLTKEMARIVDEVIPSSKTMAFQRKSRTLRGCEGEDECLAALGRYLKADFIVTGNLAGLGKHYVVTLKLVDTKSRRSVRSISEPLAGEAENLIEAVRLAAYRLLAPQSLLGSLRVLVNHPDAKIFVGKKYVGKSPLRSPITDLEIGRHTIKITHKDFVDLVKTVEVRFQKTTTVNVNLVKPQAKEKPHVVKEQGPLIADRPTPFYSKWWFWTGVGIGAAVLGATAGWAVSRTLGPHPVTVRLCDDGACH